MPDVDHRPPRVPFKWWNTLFFRIALVVNVAVLGVLGGFSVYDYRRHEHTQVNTEVERLLEEAKVLRVGRLHLPGTADFQMFLDEFCRQMGAAASPGHHIALFDRNGTVVLRAHERADNELETAMAAGEPGQPGRFVHHGGPYLSVSLDSGRGETIVVAESLAPVEALVRAQRASTIASMGTLVAIVFGITTIAFLIWVRDPLRRLTDGVAAIACRRFHTRVPLSGSAELRFLAERVNEMAQSLQTVELARLAEMGRARDIQERLLPDACHPSNGFETAALFFPAASVGGDLYDIVDLPDGSLLLAMLDVSGHGVPAALYMALLRTVLRHHAEAGADLPAIASAMNHELCAVGGPGVFATCFTARLRQDENRVRYVSAGHDPAIVLRPNGETELLAGRNLVLGVDPGERYRMHAASLEPNDRLIMFTDGLHEVFDPNDQPLGRDGLMGLLLETRTLSTQRQLEQVVERVRVFRGDADFDDDVTVLAARRK